MLKMIWKGCTMCRWIYGFLGERKSEEQVALVLVIREMRDNMTWATLVPRKGTEFLGMRREQRSSLPSLGTTESHLGVTTNQRLRRWRGKSDKLVKREARLFQGDHRWERARPKESSNAR